MIAFVHGMAVDMTESSVVVEAGGIGYEIYMTGADLSEIRMGEDVKVHTYFSVREDAMKLYGFRAKDDLQMFKLLLGVNGVGPKAALGVLAGITADELRFAILSDDVKTLSKAPGIGKKTAQKLILELKDKLSLEEAFEARLEKQGGWLVMEFGWQQWEPVRFRMAGRRLLRLWLRWDTAVRMRFVRCVRLRMCRRMMWKVF